MRFYYELLIIFLPFTFSQSDMYDIMTEETPTVNTTLSLDLSTNATMSPINVTKDKTSTSTNSFVSVTTFYVNTSVNSSSVNTTTAETTSRKTTQSSTTTQQSATVTTNDKKPKKSWSGSNRWLVISVVVTLVVIIVIGIIYYQRKQRPYRRFIQNWQSRDNDPDNIILELEEPEVSNSQWPNRISLA